MMKKLTKTMVSLVLIWGCFDMLQAQTIPLDTLKRELKKTVPEMVIEEMKLSEIPRFYRVHMGVNVFYLSEDGRYLITGDVLDLKESNRDKWNVTENQRRTIRLGMLNEIKQQDMIVYLPKTTPKTTLTIFTDLECHYCHKLHEQVPKLNALGVAVRYLAFPRQGSGSESFKKSVSVWCSDDKKTALSLAKSGKTIAPKTCKNTVLAQFELGRKIGVRATPAIVFEDGTLSQGFLEADALAKEAMKHIPEQ